MIDVVCPRCNKILLVYDADLVFDDELLVKSLCCDEVFYISYESEDRCLERHFTT